MTPDESKTKMSDSQIAMKISQLDMIVVTLTENLSDQKKDIKEQWEKHDIRSDNNWKEIKDQFKETNIKLETINRSIGALPCEVHNERIVANTKSKAFNISIIIFVITQTILFASAWGAIKKTVAYNERIINEKVLK